MFSAYNSLSLRTKLLLIAALPLIVVSSIMAWVFINQSNALLDAEISTIRAEFAESKRLELRNYAFLAMNSIRKIYETEPGGRAAAQDSVKAILHDMEYGDDGYFFIYDSDGKNLVHPRLTELVGRNLWNLQDANGDFVIRNLIEKAQNKPEGDYHPYVWMKPSNGEITPKLGYSIYLPKWGWMFGTGLYLDDIESQVAVMENQLNNNIQDTSKILLAVTAAAVLLIVLSLLFFRLTEQRMADEKLRGLTKRIVDVQEEERKRVSHELHDSISQLLISVRYTLDAAASKAKSISGAFVLVEKASNVLDEAIGEVRRISKDLRPSVLDDIGLSSAIYGLCEDFSESTGLEIDVEADKGREQLTDDARTALYRVVQEAMTNIAKHADATRVQISLKYGPTQVVLKICDNGRGFKPDALQGQSGLGVRNMRERVESHNGILLINSKTTGQTKANTDNDTSWATQILVRIPTVRHATKTTNEAA